MEVGSRARALLQPEGVHPTNEFEISIPLELENSMAWLPERKNFLTQHPRGGGGAAWLEIPHLKTSPSPIALHSAVKKVLIHKVDIVTLLLTPKTIAFIRENSHL